MIRSIFLALLLSSTALAANPVFGAYVTDQCDTCLDQVYESCPGDYQTRPYATCMCAGDGSANFVSCMSSCDAGLNEPANAAATFYGYCLMFFKEMCDGALEFVSQETYAKQCSKEAIKAGGIGEKGNDGASGDDNDSEKESDSNGDDDSDESTEIAVPTKTNESSSEKTNETGESNETDAATTTDDASKTSETAQTTSGAKATAIPAVALFAGLGLQFINV